MTRRILESSSRIVALAECLGPRAAATEQRLPRGLRLLRFDEGRNIDAPSMMLKRQFGIADRITLTQWTGRIFWRSFRSGVDSEIELILRIVGGVASALAARLSGQCRHPDHAA